MRTLNLFPEQVARQRKVDLLNYYTLLAGMVVVLGAIVLAGLLLLFDQVYRLNLASAKDQKAQAESQAALYLDVEKKGLALEKQLEDLKRASGQTTSWATLLNELQRLIPSAASVQSINVQSGGAAGKATKTTISGRAASRRTVGEFQVALSQSPLFSNAEIANTILTGSGAVDFKISTDINFDKLNGPAK